jgi:hypothetical protein
MPSLIAKNIRTWAGGFDLTGSANNASLSLDHDVHDVTVFTPVGSGGARLRACGLEDITAASQGFWAAGTGSVDEDAFNNWGAVDQVLSMSPDGAEGSVVYGMRTGRLRYQMFGEHGAPAPFALDFHGSHGETAVARGLVFKHDQSAISGTGLAGTALQLGAVGASQYLYAWANVLTAGTTITIQVQSSVDNTFASPTTRMTLGPITTTGGVWGTRVAGAITDTWWRLNVSAVTGSFTFAGFVGIR